MSVLVRENGLKLASSPQLTQWAEILPSHVFVVDGELAMLLDLDSTRWGLQIGTPMLKLMFV